MIFSADFRIGFTLTNRLTELSNKGLLTILGEIAEMHSSSVGFGVTDIYTTKLSWALLNWKVKVIKRPKYGETITINTWARPSNRLNVYRDFEVCDSDGNIMAIATSKWVLIDIFTHKIVKIPEELENKYNPEDKTAFDDEESITLPKLKEIDNYTVSLYYKIRRADIDVNEHVNNLCYLDIAREILPEDDNCTVDYNEFEIMYRHQIKFEDDITVYYGIDAGTHYVVVKNNSDERLHSVMKFK